jgi:hypothetical protein
MMLIAFLLLMQLWGHLPISRRRGHQVASPKRMICSSTRKNSPFILKADLHTFTHTTNINTCIFVQRRRFCRPPFEEGEDHLQQANSCHIRSSRFITRSTSSFFPEGKINSFDSCLSPFDSRRACEYRNSFILDDDSLSSSPRVYIRMLAVECRVKGDFNVIITYLSCVMS